MANESTELVESTGAPQELARPAIPAPSRGVWERIREHKIAQWTLAYAAAACPLVCIRSYRLPASTFEGYGGHERNRSTDTRFQSATSNELAGAVSPARTGASDFLSDWRAAIT